MTKETGTSNIYSLANCFFPPEVSCHVGSIESDLLDAFLALKLVNLIFIEFLQPQGL